MSIEKIIEELKSDKRNESYTKKGIEPIFQVNKDSKILLIGQAPGLKVQETGILFDDKSGENLTNWMGIDMKTLHSKEISILPMDFYFPGKGKSGDLAPRKFIADTYHKKMLEIMDKIKLTILLGEYSQKYYLGDKMERNLTLTVKNYKKYLPKYFPLIHPSPLNNRRIAKNPRFKTDVLPALKDKVHDILEK